MSETKIENLKNAIAKLNEGVEMYNKNKNTNLFEMASDSLIQRFEFTYELCWKCMYDFLWSKGVVLKHRYPEAVIKEAFAAKIIDDESVWLDIIKSRNLMSHTYKHADAVKIAKEIASKYAVAMTKLYEILI
jgi:nucleotidyltransferase substrate binding protein (TIGR01987 family)